MTVDEATAFSLPSQPTNQAPMSAEKAKVIQTAIITGGVCFIAFLFATQGRAFKISGDYKGFTFSASLSRAVIPAT